MINGKEVLCIVKVNGINFVLDEWRRYYTKTNLNLRCGEVKVTLYIKYQTGMDGSKVKDVS